MNTIIERYLNLVKSREIQTSDQKRVNLFNAFCMVWYCIAIIRIVMELFQYGTLTTIVIGHFSFALLIMLAQFLHYGGKFMLAYVVLRLFIKLCLLT